MAYDEALAERIRAALGGDPGISERKMFGGLAFMKGDSMFAGVVKDDLMVRVGPEKHDEALARPGARPMDFTGRPMRGFLFVTPEGLASEAALKAWLDECMAFVRSLPAKRLRPSRRKHA